MRPVTLNPSNSIASFKEIERASHEADLTEIAQNFAIGNAPGAQRAFNGSSVQLSAAGIGNGVDTTLDVLFTYTLPANALNFVGGGISIRAAGTFALSGNIKTVQLTIGGSFVLADSNTTGYNWLIEGSLYKIATNSQLFTGKLLFGRPDNAAGIVGCVNTSVLSLTDSAGITIQVLGKSASAAGNDVLANLLAVTAIDSDTADAFATWISDCQKGGMNRTT